MSAAADPVTGQAAWYDLRVRVERADPKEDAVSLPQFESLSPPQGQRDMVDNLRYGAKKSTT